MQNKRNIVFIDRDGVINKDPGRKCYVTKWGRFKFLPKVLEALSRLTEAGFAIAIVSNQSGVAKGLMTKKDLDNITENMLRRIKQAKGRVMSVQYCIHKDGDNCSCRKPKTGLFRKALKEINKSQLTRPAIAGAPNSELYFIGDSERDIIAGKNFGCKTALVLSGKTKKISDTNNWQAKPDYIAKDIYESVNYICNCRDRT